MHTSFYIKKQIDCEHLFFVRNQIIYSVLKAFTGSLLLAILDGINPAIIVRNILINTNIIPACQGKNASTLTPVTDIIILLIGIVRSIVTPIPINPDTKPVIKVSALNTLEISLFEAPIALKIYCAWRI